MNMNKSSTANDTGFLKHLVLRLMIQAVMMFKMAYTNMSELMKQLLL